MRKTGACVQRKKKPGTEGEEIMKERKVLMHEKWSGEVDAAEED